MPAYYVKTWLGSQEPKALYRFLEDGNAEYFAKGKGWITDTRVYKKRWAGEITESDKISEEEAMRIIQKWNNALRS